MTRAAAARLLPELRQMDDGLLLELTQRLPEGGLEVGAPIRAPRERSEVLDEAPEALACDQVVREQVAHLVRRLRALAQMTRGEAARRAKGFQVEAPREDGRVMRPYYLLQVKKPSESRYQFDYLNLLATVSAEDAARPLSKSECPMVKHG